MYIVVAFESFECTVMAFEIFSFLGRREIDLNNFIATNENKLQVEVHMYF